MATSQNQARSLLDVLFSLVVGMQGRKEERLKRENELRLESEVGG